MADSPLSSRPASPASGGQSPTLGKISTKSRESLSTHPLEADTGPTAAVPTSKAESTLPTSPITSSVGLGSPPSGYNVKYKPRQRPVSHGSQTSISAFSQPSQVSVAATTATSVTSPLSASPGDHSVLANKLHFQSLQASAQAAGLSHESSGWLMLQKLVSGAERDNEKDKVMGNVMRALRTGKALLLLPSEPASASELKTSFLKDHILLKDGNNVTTLGGLRGFKEDGNITFMSCVPSLDLAGSLLSETAILGLLSPGTPAITPGSTFPTLALGKQIDVHIPRAKASAVPAKAGTRSRSLASIFGGQRSISASSTLSPGKVDTGIPLAPEASDAPQHAGQPVATISVPAWTIEKALKSKSILKTLQNSMQANINACLGLEDSRLSSMVLDFILRFQPTSKTPVQPSPIPADPNANLQTVDLANASIVETTAAVQEFFYDVRQKLEEINRERVALADVLAEPDEKAAANVELLDIDKILGQVEDFVCETLYDKLFAPLSSTDRLDDESLSMRIAGLHMLDITLDHLGIQTETSTGDAEYDDVQRTIKDGLDEIVSLCGREFQKLQYSSCRTPVAKLNVLISVHKIIADSLEVLPAITIRQDGDRGRGTTSPPPSNAQFIELSDDTKSLGTKSSKKSLKRLSVGGNESSSGTAHSAESLAARNSHVPSIKLHDASFREPYQVSTPAEFMEDGQEAYSGQDIETVEPEKATANLPTNSSKQNSTSADAILPLLIYAVIQANPVRLVSHVMFVQRFRADSLMAGEGEYCLCNMEAVRTFLMSCDIASLGLGGSAKFVSPADLTAPQPRIRQRAGQHLDSMVGTAVGSAGRVLGQAADIGIGGYRILGGLLARTPQSMDVSQQPKTIEDVQSMLAGGGPSPSSANLRETLLRRGTIGSATTVKTKETEMQDVAATAAAPEIGKPSTPLSSSATISSRLASLPGLARFSSPQSNATDVVREESSDGQGFVSGFMSSMPSMPRPFSTIAVPTSDNKAEHRADGASTAGEASDALATPVATEAQARRSTISIFATPFTSATKQNISSPLLSPTPSQSGSTAQNLPSQDATKSDRARGLTFMSHGTHHDSLKTASRSRSGSTASITSGPSTEGLGGPLGAVSNLVSSVKHAYTPSVSSQTSTSNTSVLSSSEPPIQRFLDCDADDLKMSEVALLLADYKRLAARLGESRQ